MVLINLEVYQNQIKETCKKNNIPWWLRRQISDG